MSAFLSCDNVAKAFGARELFNHLSLKIHAKERVGLIGPNGAGKSTLLKMLAGLMEYDAGVITTRNGIRLVYVPQVEALNPKLTVLQAALEASAADPEEAYQKEAQAIVILGKMGFDNVDQPVGDLSGGWLKRLSIARQLAREPDIVLLDEPTNHLDIMGIEWLEQFLAAARFAYVMVTHDRVFLNAATNRIIELNPMFDGGMLSFNCAYDEFLRRREAFLLAERARYESLANKSRREQEWVKSGVKARGTKSRSRLQEAEALLHEVKKRKKQTTPPDRILIQFDKADRKTKRLVVGHNVSKRFDAINIVDKLDFVLTPGVRVGLLGANGVGKTTLMKMIAGEIQPDSGGITITPGCQVLHFDQKRQLLDENQTLKDALTLNGGDTVIYRGKPLHVSAWARKLKFQGEQLMTPVGKLSGGERARVIMGRLMLQPADVLLLDEPTNDLDIPSLEVLEESLLEFPGAIVLVTHDRAMLDRVSTILLALDGTGTVTPYASYQQWQHAQADSKASTKAANKSDTSLAGKPKQKPVKLTYKDQRELDMMETTILQAEQHFADLQANPVAHDTGQPFLDYCEDLKNAQAHIDALYARWAELEAKQAGLAENES